MIALFATEPPLGTRILLDDQAYELVDVQPYTRKSDGRPTRLLTWETCCPTTGCDTSFRVHTGLTVSALSRRCEDHRFTAVRFKPVKGRRGRKVRVQVEFP
jgi:hypothetical protein